MSTKAVIVSALAAIAAAMPGAAAKSSPNYFTALSSHTGVDIVHLRGISASGQRFYLNKATSAYCPQVKNLDCSKYGNATVFAYNSDGTMSMNVAVPGGQQVYVASGGALGYTGVHSANVPQDAQRATFNYAPQTSDGGVGTLTFDNQGFVVCPTKDAPVYQVFAWTPKDEAGAFRWDCIGIQFATAKYSGASSYQYD